MKTHFWHKLNSDRPLYRIANYFILVCIAIAVFGLSVGVRWIGVEPKLCGILILVSLIVGITLTISFFKTDEVRLNAALLIVVSVICLYLLELGARIIIGSGFSQQPSIEKMAKKEGATWDNRKPLEVITDLAKSGQRAYPAAVPIGIINNGEINGLPSDGGSLLPLGGISNALTLLCKERGRWIFYQSDEHGFNNPTGQYNKPADILMIGDSYAEGFCSNSNSTVAGLLRGMGRKVVNIGKGGNGPLLEFAGLREYGPILKPKIVLWMYFEGSDLGDIGHELKSPLLVRYLNDLRFKQNLVSRQDRIDQVLRAYIEKEAVKVYNKRPRTAMQNIIDDFSIKKFLILGESRGLLGLIRENTSGIRPYQRDTLKQVLLQSKTLSATWNGKLYLVYLPTQERYAENHGQGYLSREAVLSIATELGIPIIDFHTIISAQKDPLSMFPYRVPGHYTDQAQALLANQIRTALNKDGS